MADDKAWRAKQAAAFYREQTAARARDDNRQQDAERLEGNLAKKIMTAGVGALAAFEEAFGYLWGCADASGESCGGQQDQQELDENQRAFLRLWEGVRTQVFDLVNQQQRGARAEISLHLIEFKGNQIRFKMRNQ